MIHDERPQMKGGWMSRRSLNRMFLGAPVVALAMAQGATAQESAASPALSSGTMEDQLAIRQLVYRFAMALDSLDKEALVDCFAVDSPVRAHLDPVIEEHRQYEHTMHQVLNHLCTIRGNAAEGITYCVASMVKRAERGLTKFDVYFAYRDQFVKQASRWFLRTRALDIVFSTEATPVQPGAPLLGAPVKAGSFRTPQVRAYLKR